MPSARLVHSPKGFLRYMQMSCKTLFAFVEGIECDCFIYGQVCALVCGKRKMDYGLCRANEIPPYAGGKNALLGYHDFLRKRKALKSILSGKETVAVFFLDKDIDDILRQKRRSQHIIYTRYYDVQNDIFLNGDLTRGCASAASLDPAVLDPLLSNSRLWCSEAAERWREWVVLCLVTACKHINHQCNFRVRSQIQCPISGKTDSTKTAQMTAHMAAKSGMSAEAFKVYHAAVRRRVKDFYSKGEQDRVFKGKWYAAMLDEDIKRVMGTQEYDKAGFASRVTSAVAATLSFPDSWTQAYSIRLETLLNIK